MVKILCSLPNKRITEKSAFLLNRMEITYLSKRSHKNAPNAAIRGVLDIGRSISRNASKTISIVKTLSGGGMI